MSWHSEKQFDIQKRDNTSTYYRGSKQVRRTTVSPLLLLRIAASRPYLMREYGITDLLYEGNEFQLDRQPEDNYLARVPTQDRCIKGANLMHMNGASMVTHDLSLTTLPGMHKYARFDKGTRFRQAFPHWMYDI
ncbi:conserved hypothetical protein [Histoplasma capsulatum var. duboisii H88]|uniref:Uncharacterized protein n=1 Tax=Ajellomyces capsulatus (strain H88) TaxID=544711 RepID=F0UKQ2_AJEC8|nr:conserved hypothetical protein [Histoplasma capsulatum var. duboisii H88]